MAALPLIARAEAQRERTAIVAPEGTFSYGDLFDASARVAGALLAGGADLAETRVAFLAPPGFHHIAVQWGIWRAGGVAVPLAAFHPSPELEYVVRDAGVEIVIGAPEFATVLRPIATAARVRYLTTPETLAARRASPAGARFSQVGAGVAALPDVAESRRAMIVYTSGTTGRPKGVVTTHANLRAQITSLVEAWEWSADDRILLFLPLTHVHGIVNVVTCALWSSAVCEMLPAFDADRAWDAIAAGRLTIFMAVPTIYGRLIAAWEAASEPARREAMSAGCRKMRLMVSGSAPLPATTFARWKEISGHALLERYGMTEFGMALASPLRGERRPGFVGQPLPGVEVRLTSDGGRPAPAGEPGEIEVRGAGVFSEYWGRPDATRAAFRDGWFRTGDTGVVENGCWRILGRTSTDIIKTGGYKVSALEIEDVLRTHPAIADCAVVGVAHDDWGEQICVVVELVPGRLLGLEELRDWAKERLAPCKIPKDLHCLPTLPRNALGKVVKSEIAKLF